MTPRSFLVAGLLLSLSATATAGTQKVSAMVLAPAELTLSVDEDGRASNVACGPAVVPSLCPLLVRAVSGWKFAPGQRDRVATAMNMELSLSLAAVPKQGGFGLQATHAALNPAAPLAPGALAPSPRSLNPPRYPRDDQMAGRTGTVVLELLLQPGSDLPRIGQTWFDGEPATARKNMVKAAMDAAALWKIDHIPEQLSLCVPVVFTLDKPAKRPGAEPCKDTYVEGFVPPTLITDATSAAF